jgi:UDP-N-acetylmuramoylalanine--D-glutamate ligase
MSGAAVDQHWTAAERGEGWRAALAGRRVTVVGLARSGVAACRLLVACRADVRATDSRPLDALEPAARELGAAGVRLFAGDHPPAAFEDSELVVLSPGVPPDQPVLAACRERGVPVIGEVELAYRAMTADVVAVTGTNGKTTTTALVGALLAATGRPVVVGGNIGRPLAGDALTIAPDGLVVAEVSSFQLETTEQFRPRVAVLLNLTPDHLDRHHTLASYGEAKARIFRAQGAEDWAVINADDPGAAALADCTRARRLWFSRTGPVAEGSYLADGWVRLRLAGREQAICPVEEIPLRGAHNVENVLAAVGAVAWANIAPEALRATIKVFRAVPHRLEWIRELRGVAFYNDSKGTNVDSTRKALAAFSEPIVLIAGGRDKGQDFAPLAAAAAGRVKAAVVIGEGRATVSPALKTVTPVTEADSMRAAVRRAFALAEPGEVVLLSPACASFDMFRDYEHRGEVFRAEVLALSPGEPAGAK